MAVTLQKMNLTSDQLHARWQMAFAYVCGMEDITHEKATTDHNECLYLANISTPFAEWFRYRFQYDMGSIGRAFRDFKKERSMHNG